MGLTLSTPEVRGFLRERLGQCAEVGRYSSRDWNEPEVLVHALSDLEEEFSRFLEHSLPRLVASKSCEQARDVLAEVREQFRHVLYHIRDPHTFDVLWPVERTRP